MKNQLLNEITPLSEKDCFILIERKKQNFNFPIHVHQECEINYIENGRGAQRVVGDSVETIDDFELVLITEPQLEHSWFTHECTSNEIYEITIQFSPNLLEGSFLKKTQFSSIVDLLGRGKRGITFSRSDILDMRPILTDLARNKEGFDSVVKFLKLLHAMAQAPSGRTLASSSFAKVQEKYDSRRIDSIMQYLNEHYALPIRLEEVADLVCMSSSSLSKFIRLHTGKSFVECLTDIRIGHSIRQMTDNPSQSISEIAFLSGFNNLSNFNRIFLKKKGCTPREFRENYAKRKVII